MPSSAAIDCFVAACRSDDRVLAAFLSGSHATGTDDMHSDIDLGLITTDATYDHFSATRAEFSKQLGKPLFLEDFDNPRTLFFILSDGTEGELAITQENSFTHMVKGPHRVLLDKKEILLGERLLVSNHEQTSSRRRYGG
jgi:predicted nucleotidyltransferase